VCEGAEEETVRRRGGEGLARCGVAEVKWHGPVRAKP
jgi:hypothetical protein